MHVFRPEAAPASPAHSTQHVFRPEAAPASPALSIQPSPSRTLLLVSALVAVVLSLASCSTEATGPGEAASAETRTITDVGGEVTIPVDPQRIVATDEPAALNLLSIGITPVAVFDSWRTAVPVAVLEHEGIEVVRTTSFFPEMEAVAALEPDLIVSSINEGFLEELPDYASIAPTVRALMQAPSDEIAVANGEYFDREEEAAAVATALKAATAKVAQAQPDPAVSLSVLLSWAQDNSPMYMDETNPLTNVIGEAGFTRPALQSTVPADGSIFGGWTPFSAETLPEHDADVLAVAVAAQYNLDGITGLPLYDSLDAVTSDRAVVVDGDMWAGGSVFYAYWVLADLESIVAGDDTVGTIDDAADRWDGFLAAIGR